jgi:hypothetical protein
MAGQYIGMDNAAAKRWEEWFKDINERSLSEVIVGARARVPTYAAKVALLYAWDLYPNVRNGLPWYLTLEALEPAIHVAEMHLQSLVALADRLATSRDMRDRRRVLEALDSGPCTYGMIIRRAKLLKRRVHELLESMCEEGAVEKLGGAGMEPMYAVARGHGTETNDIPTGSNGAAPRGDTLPTNPEPAAGSAPPGSESRLPDPPYDGDTEAWPRE